MVLPRLVGERAAPKPSSRRVQAVAMWPRRQRRPWRLIVALAVVLLLLPVLGAGALLVLVEPAVASDRYVEAVAGEPPLLNPVLAPYTSGTPYTLAMLFWKCSKAMYFAGSRGTVSRHLTRRPVQIERK